MSIKFRFILFITIITISCSQKNNANTSISTPQEQKANRLTKENVYYSFESYTYDSNPYGIPIYDFHYQNYKQVSITLKEVFNEQWSDKWSVNVNSDQLNQNLIFEDGHLVRRNFNKGWEAIEYDSLNRISKRNFFVSDGTPGAYYIYKYSNDSTLTISLETKGNLMDRSIYTFNSLGFITSSKKVLKEPFIYKVYKYDSNNLLKSTTLYKDYNDTSEFEHQQVFSYHFNQHGDWDEVVISELSKISTTPYTLSKLTRIFE